MDTQTYTRYQSSRFGARPMPEHVWPLRRNSHRIINRAGIFRKFTTLAIIGGLVLAGYAGFVFGYGYVEARTQQSDLRSQFSISGNGSVEQGYVGGEAEAMKARLGYLELVGEISIPGIGVNLMVVEGSDDEALKKGPGHIPDTPFPGSGGNFAVAADRVLYGAPFLNLNEVRVGDEVRVKMPYATFVYRVQDSFIVTPEDITVLQSVGNEALTLITCDPPWDIKQRIVVRGELEQVLPAGSGS